MNQPAPQRKRPDWDPHGVAEPYLISLREDAREGRFEPEHVDDLMESLVLDLREVYGTRNIDRALEHLERIRASIEHQAQEARSLHNDLAQVRPRRSDLSHSVAGPTTLKAIAAAREWLKFAPAQLGRAVSVAKAAIAHGQSALQSTRGPRRAAEGEAPRTSSRSPLNARALRKSVLPTWVMLVGCSWIALVWGAMITLPIGVGLGIFASMLGGVFVVPLWGTVFGFLGMGSARSATLRQMQFKPLSPYDRLREQAARYANQLDIPAPELGSNRDDHSKNISFLMDAEGRWSAAPAYDLTFSSGPNGFQSMSVMDEARQPTREHLRRLGLTAGIRRATINIIIEEVSSAIAEWPRLARAHHVTAANISFIGKVLERSIGVEAD